jgi:DNA primase
MGAEIEAIKAANPIEDVAASFGVKLKPGGKYLSGRCPFHPDRTPSFFVDPRTGRWRCFGRCATRWLDVFDFVGMMRFGDRWNARDAEMFKETLAEMKGSVPRRVAASPPARFILPDYKPVPKTPDVMALLHRVTGLYEIQLRNAGYGPGTPLAYLRARGLSDETIRAAGIGYCSGTGLVKYLRRGGIPVELAREIYLIDGTHGDREFFRGRIVFPDRDEAGRVIHLCGRAFDYSRLHPDTPKYLSLKGFDKPLHGWGGLDKAENNRPVCVVESPPDRLTLIQWGYDAIATLGTGLTESSVRLLANLKRPFIYIPHNDGGTGLRACQSWLESAGHGLIIELPPNFKDVNELGALPDGRETFNQKVRATS